ncbi:MAG: hypothetical protein ACYC06_02085 [Ilumatobacteraceae bacterium]
MLIAIGIILMIVGFVFMIPHDSVPGSIAHRNVQMGSSHIVETPGHRVDDGRRRKWIKVLIGVVFFGLGLVLIAIGS